MTYTYALVAVSPECYREVRDKLIAAGSASAVDTRSGRERIDMHGLALVVEEDPSCP